MNQQISFSITLSLTFPCSGSVIYFVNQQLFQLWI